MLYTDLHDGWVRLDTQARAAAFKAMPDGVDDAFFLSLPTDEQATLVLALPEEEPRLWLRLLPPDDCADLVQAVPEDDRPALVRQLDDAGRREVQALLAYAEDVAGGLMSPRFARLRPEMTVGEAIRYLRQQATAGVETIYVAYVLDAGNRLLGVTSFRDLFAARDATPIADVMRTDFVRVSPDLDQEKVARVIAQHDLMAVPVVNGDGVLRGIVTVDDVIDVVNEEASEDIHKLGGVEALDLPYLQTGFFEMVRKRAGWLSLLFVGELLTASAMAAFEEQIAQMVVLAVFVPLIISSGGNSGSQAATLVIRAMALGEVTLADLPRVVGRELGTGLALGGILAALGLVRVALWQGLFGAYGAHWVGIAITVSASLLGVVVWGTLAGSLLPLLIRRAGLDPAVASAPFVATLIDVSGLVIYFSVAQAALGGVMPG